MKQDDSLMSSTISTTYERDTVMMASELALIVAEGDLLPLGLDQLLDSYWWVVHVWQEQQLDQGWQERLRLKVLLMVQGLLALPGPDEVGSAGFAGTRVQLEF